MKRLIVFLILLLVLSAWAFGDVNQFESEGLVAGAFSEPVYSGNSTTMPVMDAGGFAVATTLFYTAFLVTIVAMVIHNILSVPMSATRYTVWRVASGLKFPSLAVT